MTLLRILLASLFTVSAVSAQSVIFSDNFGSYTLNEPLSSPWGSVTPNPTQPDAAVEVVLDTGDYFGAGTSNQILHVLDTSSTWLTRADMRGLSFNVATLSFDFYEVAGVSGTPWRVSFGLDSSSAGNIFQATLDSGNPGSYSLNAKHTFQMVVNTSTSNVDYAETTLNSMHYDLWIDGELVTSNAAAETIPSGFVPGSNMTAFRFTTGSSSLSQEIYIDNVLLTEGAVIPEPSSLAWLGFAGLSVLALRHRRNTRRA
ncbi:MAG: hypothetical protein Q7Q73_00725 [Verrucomicrobiota bacterium JB024]|nr:hypothetical protein [Verrucomicrobiota bacterium JB024]